MVVIRLSRGGTNKRPFMRVTVADSRFARDKRYIERIGFYNPVVSDEILLENKDELQLKIDLERYSYWCSKGAQPSLVVKRLVKQYCQISGKSVANPNSDAGAGADVNATVATSDAEPSAVS